MSGPPPRNPRERRSTALIQDLLRVWEEKKAARAFPARRDFDLPAVYRWAGDLEFVDIVEDAGKRRRYRYRLVGTRINRIDGKEITGRFADEVFCEPVFEAVTRDYDEAVRIGAPVVSQFERVRNARGSVMTYDKLVLPLSDDGARITGLMVYVVEH